MTLASEICLSGPGEFMTAGALEPVPIIGLKGIDLALMAATAGRTLLEGLPDRIKQIGPYQLGIHSFH